MFSDIGKSAPWGFAAWDPEEPLGFPRGQKPLLGIGAPVGGLKSTKGDTKHKEGVFDYPVQRLDPRPQL